MTDREIQVLSMRADGKSFRAIAAYFNISPSRVAQLYQRAKKRQEEAEPEGYIGDDESLTKLGLNARNRNALDRAGIKTVGQIVELLGSDQLTYVRNFGPIAYEEVRTKLKAH